MRHNYKKSLSLALLALTLGACAGKKPITSSLFTQSGRPHIYLPTSSEERQGMLSERAIIQTHTDTIRREQPSMPTDPDAITLETLVVTADRPLVRISTVRNGYVTLKFLISLPKAFMDERWQVNLMPTLLNGDERIALPPVLLQGKQFKEAQDKEYAKFGDFKGSIIDSAKYDSTFFDKKRHDAFIGNLQQEYFKSYRRDLKLQLSYDRWRSIMEQRGLLFDAINEGNYDSHKASKGLEMLKKAYEEDLYGSDSSKIIRKFNDKYTAERRELTLSRLARPIRLKDVPWKYRTLYQFNLTIDSLRNKSVTEEDSLRVAEYTYKFKDIAKNEGKRKNLDTYERHMIKLVRIDSTHATLPITTDKDFIYMYSRDIEVKEGLQRRLRLQLDTRVTALDRSTWWQTGRDTLSFVISGMNDLVDKTLASRLQGSDREEYEAGLARLAVYDYKGALDKLNQYPDFNSALCLAALGYNAQAIQLLDKLSPSNAKMDYLRAIIYSRDKQLEHARHFLLQAVRQEIPLAYKAEIEPEFAPLMEQYPSLQKEILQIAEGDDF